MAQLAAEVPRGAVGGIIGAGPEVVGYKRNTAANNCAKGVTQRGST